MIHSLSTTAMNYLVCRPKLILNSFNLVTAAFRSVHCGWMFNRSLCKTAVAADTHYHSSHFVYRSFSSAGNGDNRSNSNYSSYFRGVEHYIPVIGTSALVVGVLAFRWYVNSEPDSEKMLKDAIKSLGKMPKDQPSQGSDNTSDIGSATRSGLSTDPSTLSPCNKEMDTEKKDYIELIKNQTESAVVLPDQTEENSTTVLGNAESSELICIDPSKSGFPSHVRYLIIGGGTAGMAAARAIRASDPTSRVLMVAGGEPVVEGGDGQEPLPYLRPALSKELWRRDSTREGKILQTNGDMRRHSWFYYEPESFFLQAEALNTAEFGGVALLRGDLVVGIDPDQHAVYLLSGRQLSYDRCLLATGGRPKQLPQSLEYCSRTNTNLLQSGHVSYFRTLADYRHLRTLRDKLHRTGGRIAVVGGGFLGSELTVSLLTEPVKPHKPTDTESESVGGTEKQPKGDRGPPGVSVMHIFQESAPMGHVLPPCLASAVSRVETNRGADLRSSADVVDITLVPNKLTETSSRKNATVEWNNRKPLKALQTVIASETNQQDQLNNRRIRLRIRRNDDIFSPAVVEEVEVDHLVCAIGLEANTKMASSAGLEIDHVNGGFLVNAELESRAGVYVAGDAASFWDPVLGCRRRVEHLNFAEETGTLAGKNMAASLIDQQKNTSSPCKETRYHQQSSVWSNLGQEVNWDAVGLVDSRNLLTRSFFSTIVQNDPLSVQNSELGSLSRGVVFYLTPKERRLVGLLLWNIPEFIYTDKEFAAPSRLSIARSILAERRLIGQSLSKEDEQIPLSEEQELQQLATQFDIYSELEDDYAELKAYIKKKQKEVEMSTSDDTGNVNEADKHDSDTTSTGW